MELPAIGSGDLDLIGFMDYLVENGYDGPFSIEIEFTEDFTMRDKKKAIWMLPTRQ